MLTLGVGKLVPITDVEHCNADVSDAAVGDLPEQGVLANDGQHVAQGVAAVGQFELGYLGTHVAAQGRRERRGHHGGHVENMRAVQGAVLCTGGTVDGWQELFPEQSRGSHN